MGTLSLRISRHRQQTAPPATPLSVKAVKSWLVPSYWEFVSKYIDDALKHANGELKSEDIYQYLLAERMFLFVAGNPICGASVCEVVQYVRKKAIRVVTLGGENFTYWKKPLDEELEKWGQMIGADCIEAYVRKGMVPHLEGIGYEQIYIGMSRNINGKRIGDTNSK